MIQISNIFTGFKPLRRCCSLAAFLVLGLNLLILQLAVANLGQNTAGDDSAVNSFFEQAYQALQQGNTDAALIIFEQVLQQDDRNLAALLGRALIYAEQSRHAEAFSAYNQIVEHFPTHAIAWNGRGLAAFNLEDFDQALISFKRATQDLPVNGFFYESLAWTQICRGEYQDAAESAKTSMLMYSRNGDKAIYPLLIAYFSYLESGDLNNSQRTLKYAKNNYDPESWPAPVINYLAGELSQSDLISFVMNAAEETEAHTYIGLKLRGEQKFAAANAHFEWVSQHGESAVFEYTLARAMNVRRSMAELKL